MSASINGFTMVPNEWGADGICLCNLCVLLYLSRTRNFATGDLTISAHQLVQRYGFGYNKAYLLLGIARREWRKTGGKPEENRRTEAALVADSQNIPESMRRNPGGKPEESQEMSPHTPLKENYQETRNKKKTTTARARGVVFQVPETIDSEHWKAWEEHRKKLRKPMTDHARNLTVSKLEKLSLQGHSPNDLIDLAIERGWQGIYAPSDNGSRGQSKADKDRKEIDRIVNEVLGEKHGKRKDDPGDSLVPETDVPF